MGNYRLKTKEVDALRLTVDIGDLKAGGWLVVSGNKQEYLTNAEFEDLYEENILPTQPSKPSQLEQLKNPAPRERIGFPDGYNPRDGLVRG